MRSDDPEFAATLHLLCAPILAHRTARYIDEDRREIAWTALMKAARPWSDGERLMLEAAHAMWNWNHGKKATLGALYSVLDDQNLILVIEALAIRRRLAVTSARPL